MGIKAIDYDNLSEGDLVTWYGVHVLRWEDEIMRPYGIFPTIAFVQDNTLEDQIAALLEALKKIEVMGRNTRPIISKGAHMGNIARAAIALADGSDA